MGSLSKRECIVDLCSSSILNETFGGTEFPEKESGHTTTKVICNHANFSCKNNVRTVLLKGLSQIYFHQYTARSFFIRILDIGNV